MSAAELLSIAAMKGLVLVLDGDRLSWEANHQPPDDLLAIIKIHKLALIEELKLTMHPRWLDELAGILKCEPAYLKAHGFIDHYDLVEQGGSNPEVMARLIRSNPDWCEPPEQEQVPFFTHDEPQSVIHITATASTEWIEARNQWHNHFAGCRDCYPPARRYCAIGTELHQQYNTVTDKQIEADLSRSETARAESFTGEDNDE